jgi:hypothetical protein
VVPINREEERRWLADAVEQHMMMDVVSRMREIALLMSTPPAVLEAQGITHDDIEGMGQLYCMIAGCISHISCLNSLNTHASVGFYA